MTQIWLTPVGVRDEVSDTVLAKAKATVDLTNQHWLSYRQARVSGLCRNKRWIQRGWGSSFCLREFKRWCNRVWKEVQGGVVWHLFPVYVALPVLPKLLNSCPVGSDPVGSASYAWRQAHLFALCSYLCCTLSGWNWCSVLTRQWVWTRWSAHNLMFPIMHSACWGSMLSHLEKHIKHLYSWMIEVAGFTVGIMREPSLSWQWPLWRIETLTGVLEGPCF